MFIAFANGPGVQCIHKPDANPYYGLTRIPFNHLLRLDRRYILIYIITRLRPESCRSSAQVAQASFINTPKGLKERASPKADRRTDKETMESLWRECKAYRFAEMKDLRLTGLSHPATGLPETTPLRMPRPVLPSRTPPAR
jgi:hypothetical protein